MTRGGRARRAIALLSCVAMVGCAQPASVPVTTQPDLFPVQPTAPSVYTIAAHDALRIRIYSRTAATPLVDLDGAEVAPDGRLFIPMVGDVMAEGRTTTGLRDEIVARLETYLVEPLVDVVVRGGTVSVLGEVGMPGAYPISPDTTALEILALAGGVTRDGDFGRVVLMRRTPAPDATAGITRGDADIEELVRNADVRQNVLLRPRDIVYVPPSSVSRSDRFFAHIATIASPFTQIAGTIIQVLILIAVND
jgi:polysaccharide export outer membrane protein